MRLPWPTHAERITLGGETAWIWETHDGWSVFQGRHRVDLENFSRLDQPMHILAWQRFSAGQAREGGGDGSRPGHVDRDAFLLRAEGIFAAAQRESGMVMQRLR